MGAVKAVCIAPALKQAGLIVGGTTGGGILLRRPGADWSDPVFLGAARLAEAMEIRVLLNDTVTASGQVGPSRETRQLHASENR